MDEVKAKIASNTSASTHQLERINDISGAIFDAVLNHHYEPYRIFAAQFPAIRDVYRQICEKWTGQTVEKEGSEALYNDIWRGIYAAITGVSA